MLNITGYEFGNIYIQDSGISLMRCNQFEIKEDKTTIGSFISGFRHSGEAYYSFTQQEEHFTAIVVEKSIYKIKYQILQGDNSKSIGCFEYSTCKWLNPTGGMMSLSNGETHHFKEGFGILAHLWHNHKRVELQSDSIKYFGDFELDNTFKAIFTGTVEMEGTNQMFPAILGAFFIDRKFRKWIRSNID